MRNNKLTIVFFLTVFVIGVVLAFIYTRQTREVTPPPTLPVAQISLPPNQQTDTQSAAFRYADGADITIPERVQTFTAKPSAPGPVIETVLRRLSQSPKTSSFTVDGETTTVWEWDTGSIGMTVGSDGTSTFYISDVGSSGVGWTGPDLIRAITSNQEYAAPLLSAPTETAGGFSFSYPPSLPAPTRSVHAYTYKGVRLLFPGSNEQMMTLYSDPSGRIRYATVTVPIVPITQISDGVPIQKERILQNLNDHNGYYVGSNIGGVWEDDSPPTTIDSVTITSILPSLLYEQATQRFTPVYIIDGYTDSPGAAVKKPTRFLLNAVSE